jgi:hypothetical protein
MNTDEILSAIDERVQKVETEGKVSPSQLSQLAAVTSAALKAVGFVDSSVQRFARLSLLGLIAGREIKSSKELSFAQVVALCSRWTQMDNPFQPTDECLADIPVLIRALAKREGQQELSM